MPALHQFVAGFAKGDAISNEARVLRDLFRSWGLASEIYCETRRVLPELRKVARDLAGAAADLGPRDSTSSDLAAPQDVHCRIVRTRPS